MTPAAYERWRARLPLLVAAGLAWFAILTLPKGEGASFCDTSILASLSTDRLAFVLQSASILEFVSAWLLMVAAMMVPMLTRNIAHVQARAMTGSRTVGSLLFLAGYLAVWVLAGIPAAAVLVLVELMRPGVPLTLLAGLLVAVVWQFSPAKQACLNRCHRTPALGGSGMALVLSVFRYGLAQGFWCVGTCWALMVLALLAGEAHLPVMALASAFLLAERLEKPVRPAWRLRYPVVLFRMVLFRLTKLAGSVQLRAGETRKPRGATA